MLLSRHLLSQIIAQAKTLGKKIVFTNGCFDILHVGHVTYLEKASKYGDIMVIGLNSDNSVRRLKGESRPINNENDRAIILTSLKSIDYVTIFDEDTPENLIKELTPDVLIKGGDYNIKDIVGAEYVKKNGGKVAIIPLVQGKSTTNIINKMQQ